MDRTITGLTIVLYFFFLGIFTSASLVKANGKSERYLIYDVNPGEGFNLRRDVYLRVANLVKKLNHKEPWMLVLPAWYHLYHWKTDVAQDALPWAAFFDLQSLSKYIPVMEFEDFIKVKKGRIEQVYRLQHYKDQFRNGEFKEKLDIQECRAPLQYLYEKSAARWAGWFFGFADKVYADDVKCLSYQGTASFIIPFLLKDPAQTILLEHCENLLHDDFGQRSYWEARRSMRFAAHLVDFADKFRYQQLNSRDKSDGTARGKDWMTFQPARGSAQGGPYIGVHLRRGDFAHGAPDRVPTLAKATEKINNLTLELKLSKVFIATDADASEMAEIHSNLWDNVTLVRYTPTPEELELYKDGGVAIIDQWICAHARYFIGTGDSTFSFRIHEEREILGFEVKSTFNAFCTSKRGCEQPSRWMITYDDTWMTGRDEEQESELRRKEGRDEL